MIPLAILYEHKQLRQTGAGSADIAMPTYERGSRRPAELTAPAKEESWAVATSAKVWGRDKTYIIIGNESKPMKVGLRCLPRRWGRS